VGEGSHSHSLPALPLRHGHGGAPAASRLGASSAPLGPDAYAGAPAGAPQQHSALGGPWGHVPGGLAALAGAPAHAAPSGLDAGQGFGPYHAALALAHAQAIAPADRAYGQAGAHEPGAAYASGLPHGAMSSNAYGQQALPQGGLPAALAAAQFAAGARANPYAYLGGAGYGRYTSQGGGLTSQQHPGGLAALDALGYGRQLPGSNPGAASGLNPAGGLSGYAGGHGLPSLGSSMGGSGAAGSYPSMGPGALPAPPAPPPPDLQAYLNALERERHHMPDYDAMARAQQLALAANSLHMQESAQLMEEVLRGNADTAAFGGGFAADSSAHGGPPAAAFGGVPAAAGGAVQAGSGFSWLNAFEARPQQAHGGSNPGNFPFGS